jgi:hypothetical protein
MTRDPPPLRAPEAPVRAGAIFRGVWGPVGRRDAAPGSVGMDGAERTFLGRETEICWDINNYYCEDWGTSSYR